MRICMLSVHTCPLAVLGGKETGGMNVYVRELSKELGRQGFEVDVFTRSQDHGVPRVVHDLGENVEVIHVPAGPESPYDKNKIYDYLPEFIGGVQEFTTQRGYEYDIIHSHYWLSGLVARALSTAWGGKPIVQMFHTLGELKNQIAESPQQRESPCRLAAERQIMGYVNRIIAASPLEKMQMVQLYNAEASKITVIPPGVDLNLFHPIPQDEAKAWIGILCENQNILFVGRIEFLKGIETLLRALAFMVAEDPSWAHRVCVSVIGGDASVPVEQMEGEMARLHVLREELGLADLVTFRGKLAQDTLPYYYAAADVLVMPSHYESFGLVALEAMACGTPVIASRVGGLPYNVLDGITGILVPDRDPVALGQEIMRLLSDSDLHRRLGEGAARVARTYSWDKITEQVLDVYRQVIEQTEQTAASVGQPA
jgi:D-inositol-3-phosphate glycosyltransferase